MHMGTSPFGTTYQLGQNGGVETVTLTTNQIPVHSHAPLSVSGNGNQSTPEGGVWAGVATSIYTSNAPDPVNNAFNNTLGSSAGGSQPHDNMMPYLAINFIISLFGIYPSPT
jgi:microcystin-dependent protein